VLHHASIYDAPRDRDQNGWRVLVMRQWPRGVRRDRVDLWLKDAGPSTALLHAYNHDGLSWAEFEVRYRAEILEDRPSVLTQLKDLERAHGTVTILCHERIPPHAHCHRLILVDLLGGAQPNS
jgi:uncharacterized protein YeaO (DUF488 family)